MDADQIKRKRERMRRLKMMQARNAAEPPPARPRPALPNLASIARNRNNEAFARLKAMSRPGGCLSLTLFSDGVLPHHVPAVKQMLPWIRARRHFVVTGSSGTGKTSVTLLVCRNLNLTPWMVAGCENLKKSRELMQDLCPHKDVLIVDDADISPSLVQAVISCGYTGCVIHTATDTFRKPGIDKLPKVKLTPLRVADMAKLLQAKVPQAAPALIRRACENCRGNLRQAVLSVQFGAVGSVDARVTEDSLQATKSLLDRRRPLDERFAASEEPVTQNILRAAFLASTLDGAVEMAALWSDADTCRWQAHRLPLLANEVPIRPHKTTAFKWKRQRRGKNQALDCLNFSTPGPPTRSCSTHAQ